MKFLIIVFIFVTLQPLNKAYAQKGQSPADTTGQTSPCPPFLQETKDLLSYFISGKH